MQDRFYGGSIDRPATNSRNTPRGCLTQPYSEKAAANYCPFNSPNILRMSSQPSGVDGSKPACHRVLFEESEDQQQEPTILKPCDNTEGFAVLAKIISQPNRASRTTGKQNTQPEQFFSFNNRRRVRYPQTPNFKQILQSPITNFISTYQRRIDELKAQVKRKAPIVALECDSNPVKHTEIGYKFFLCLAQGCKKLSAGCESRALYKLALYIQPYDEAAWEWASKFEEELGCYETAYRLCRTGLLFTSCENLAMKYLRIAEKCDKPISDFRGVVGFLKNRANHKLYLQLSRLEWRFGNVNESFRILLYLYREAENNLNFASELARLLQAKGEFERAMDILESSIDRNVKLYSVYSTYLKMLQTYCEKSVVVGNIDYVVRKAEQNLPMEVQWRLYVQVAQLYHRLQYPQQEREYLKAALEYAPANIRWKPYLLIVKSLNLTPTKLKNSLFVVEVNKLMFVRSQQPVLYNFNEWKHYLHYSLFYLFDRNDEALKLLEGAVQRWPYAGRLWAELLFLERVKSPGSGQLLKKWEQTIRQVPKSGEVWCQGGRLLLEQGDHQRALFCFEAAVHLTPQYGDSFVECFRLYTELGERAKLKQLKLKMLYAQPFYGNVWCYLKPHTKSTALDVWRSCKRTIRTQLYQNNVGGSSPRLTALECYNTLFRSRWASQAEREKIVSAYDQLDSSRS